MMKLGQRSALTLALCLWLGACSGGGSGGGGGSADTLAPALVTAFTASAGAGQVTLSWVNPTDPDFAGLVIRRSLTDFPASVTDGVEVFNGLGSSFTDGGLMDGVRYFYTAFTFDGVPNFSLGVSDDAVPTTGTRVEISFAGIGQRGIFDPSFARDPLTNRIWMSFSEVSDSVSFPTQNTSIVTRLAFSDDAGANWTEAGIQINTSSDVNLAQPAPNNAGTITHEVSSLVVDHGAPAAERWKIFWHRYLEVNGNRLFEHSWIALKTAPTPMGPWSAERKLFVGSTYDAVNDSIIGPPEIRLNLLHPALNTTATFSEPGAVATASSLFLTMLAAEGTSQNGHIVLLELPHSTGVWEFRGNLLSNSSDGPAFGFHGFSAPDLYEKNGKFFLIATQQTNHFYMGAMVFPIADLATGALERVSGVPVVEFQVTGTANSFNGAASYLPEATASGLLYSETIPAPSPFFRIFASRVEP